MGPRQRRDDAGGIDPGEDPPKRKGAHLPERAPISSNSVAESIRSNPRFQSLVEHLHRLGPRAVGEFLIELTIEHHPDLLERLERYRRIEPDVLKVLGADQIPKPIFAVGR
jgi:hypothetical protein